MPHDQQPSVLIVEDEAIVALDLRETITELGYTVVAVAASADEAIAMVTARCPDVVLMDIRIHGTRDGIDTAAVMRAQFDVPVIYLTAHADDATLRRARETEPYGYLRKPVAPVDLRTALELAVYKHAQVRQRRERVRLTLAEAQARETQAAAVHVAPPVRGRLLVVDDDAMLLRSMKRVLRDHDAVCLESAREALALLEGGERFDLILSDLMMPDLTGMDFYERLLAFDVDLARRVVFITGGAVNAEIADFLAVVPNTWIEKPVAPDALRAMIAQHLRALA